MCCENSMEKSVDSFITGVVLKFTRSVFSWIWVLILTFWFSDIVYTSPVESLEYSCALHFYWVEGCRRACTCTDAREAQEASLPCSCTCEMICLGMCLLHPFPWHRFYLCFITVTFLCNRPEAFAVEHEGSQAETLQVYASVCLASKWYIVHHYTTKQNTDSSQNGNILEILSADSRRNSELPQLGCVHFPRWQEETSRFERPRSSGSTHDENSVVLRYLLHSFANVLQCFLDLLLLVSRFWENCLSWWSLYFPDLRIKPFPSAV